MNRLFIDTAAFLALLDADDAHHGAVSTCWRELLSGETMLVTSNYILVETLALVQNRLGMEAVRVFQEDIAPLLNVQWVGEEVHTAACSALLAAARKRLSLVDCISFEVMRRAGIKQAFTLDRHFREYGFVCMPKL